MDKQTRTLEMLNALLWKLVRTPRDPISHASRLSIYSRAEHPMLPVAPARYSAPARASCSLRKKRGTTCVHTGDAAPARGWQSPATTTRSFLFGVGRKGWRFDRSRSTTWWCESPRICLWRPLLKELLRLPIFPPPLFILFYLFRGTTHPWNDKLKDCYCWVLVSPDFSRIRSRSIETQPLRFGLSSDDFWGIRWCVINQMDAEIHW